MKGELLLEGVLELSPAIRYAALHLGAGEPLLRERQGSGGAADSERWDEIVVNPVLVELAARRGDVDCDGLHHLLIRYGRFWNLVLPLDGGHLSVILDPEAEPLSLVESIREVGAKFGAAPRPSPRV